MIGTGTYAYFWQWSERSPAPIPLADMLRDTRRLGGEVFQICDYPAILGFSDAELAETRALAVELGLTLELGTKGIGLDHLREHLRIADALGVTMLRSMVFSPEFRPTLDEARQLLVEVMPEFAAQGVTLALETYEQLTSTELVDLVQAVGHPDLGICLDPANTVAALEHPDDVIDRVGRLAVNIHAKDFEFSRRGGWVGFTLAGCRMGEGLLDYAHLLEATGAAERGLSQIVEHWLPWTDDYETTARIEREWTEHTMNRLKELKELS